MGLIEISDVQAAYGQTIDADDEATIQYYIDIVTADLEDYTGLSFSLVVDDPVICRADRHGIVEFNESVSVSLVEELDPFLHTYSEWPNSTYSFDGIDTVYNLCAYGTYRITVSYGYAVPPDSIKGIAADLVLAGSGLDPSAAQGLVKKRVGDREEQYGVSGATGAPSISLTSIQAKVLEKYRGTAWTVRT